MGFPQSDRPQPAAPAAAPSLARNRAAVMAELRRLLPRLDDDRRQSPLLFGLKAIDTHLPDGGLARGALHEIVPATEGSVACAFGFIAALLARTYSPPPPGPRLRAPECKLVGEELEMGVERPRVIVDALTSPRDPHPTLSTRGKEQRATLLRARPFLFVLPRHGLRPYPPHGRLHGHGLKTALGLDPARVILVEPAHRKETLWAMEEALRSQAPAAVVGLIDTLDLKSSQRLHLAAADAGLPLLLLRPAPNLDASAAATRWRVGTAEAARDRFGLIARPRWRLELARCRNGRPGEWVVEYDHVAHRFSLAAALADCSRACRAGEDAIGQIRRAR